MGNRTYLKLGFDWEIENASTSVNELEERFALTAEGQWKDHKNFVHVPGHYKLLQTNFAGKLIGSLLDLIFVGSCRHSIPSLFMPSSNCCQAA